MIVVTAALEGPVAWQDQNRILLTSSHNIWQYVGSGDSYHWKEARNPNQAHGHNRRV